MMQLSLRGQSYPVYEQGQGIPCLIAGLASPSFRTFSPAFYNDFQVYGSDLYFVQSHGMQDLSSVTLETLVEDMKVLEDALGLDRYVLFGHSAFGILALEYVKKYPERVAAVLMSGTPVNSNADVAAHHQRIFEASADETRKKIDAARRAQIAQEDLTKLSASERFLREYIYRDAARYWHIPDYDCSHLWEGIILDPLMEYLFTTIFPAVDVRKGLDSLQVPVFLAAGVSDYDCCPWVWKDLPHLPPKMTVSLFEQSGHWPQYEEPAVFDTRVKAWLAKL